MEGIFRHYLAIYRPLITRLNQLLEPYGLTYSLWQVIFYIEREGPSTLVEISSYYGVEKPSITRRVHRLEERELIEQIPGKDRRVKVIRLTGRGVAVYRECREKISLLEGEIMKGMAREEQELLHRLLPEIRKNLMRKGGAGDEA
ncbi:DNA-binding transcriptional regulator, MarR family [Bhargavaea ginsengi]|uniref:DNA-binding transcriptional regulator, MarR family n=1 Tax=Bhargavaea ginsengi TaxID=426757 RepID=A0A1H6Z1G7_9BACL|nr:MarR family transcriptional regulator [Bhargavaea ginsengi]MCM3086863.1 MarR family transcriptional regulator [Bhargavaea ginsengi]SEJ47373.1 DNA-binding transcriptional regulator, MarR family [Bhargavaea ginsengi]